MVDEIVSLNKLDMELYEYAKFLFAKQQRQFATSTLPQVLHMNKMNEESDCLPGVILCFNCGDLKCAMIVVALN